MKFARLLLLPIAFTAVFAVGCGSSEDDGDATAPSQPPAATSPSSEPPSATTRTAPPGVRAEGCGNTTVAGTSGLQVTGVGCPIGRGVVAAWTKSDSCATDVSRPACTVYRGYRCIGARTDAGIAVSCAQQGRSISFLARRR